MPSIAKTVSSLKTSFIVAILLSVALLIWVDPTTKEGNAALFLIAILFFTVVLRVLGALITLVFPDRPTGGAA